MQYMETFFIINYIAVAISLVLVMLLVYQLFKLLEKTHPSYYKTIGRPLANGPMHYDIEDIFSIYVRLLKGWFFAYAMVFRGIPRGFPEDNSLRKLARVIRISLTVLICLFISLIIVSYLFYQSSL
jgi:hypothetical protein